MVLLRLKSNAAIEATAKSGMLAILMTSTEFEIRQTPVRFDLDGFLFRCYEPLGERAFKS